MANIRQKGLKYLIGLVGQPQPTCVAVSKFFEPNESWTGRETWWFNLPIKKIVKNKGEAYYLLGACRGHTDDFIVLAVPNQFLMDNIEGFETRYDNKIILHLAAYEDKWLVDERGKGRVAFSRFVVS